MTSPCRLGLLGGSFDPVHVGHLHAARTAQEARALDRVVFVPAARPPHKPGRRLAAGEHRLAMLRLALAGELSWTVSDLELSRSGPSYTIDTVRALPAEVGEPEAQVFLILGYDNLAGLPGWHEARSLLTLARPLIVWRAGDGASGDGASGDGGPPAGLPATVRSLPPELVARIQEGFLPTSCVPARATDLRAALARGETRLAELPEAVGEYIREHGLYREEP
ncbi:MAG: nicotinate (nicotinamide) nucleotide adenylyltransferase [Planctomycetota bacterium]